MYSSYGFESFEIVKYSVYDVVLHYKKQEICLCLEVREGTLLHYTIQPFTREIIDDKSSIICLVNG
jgi:hypothetical protein